MRRRAISRPVRCGAASRQCLARRLPEHEVQGLEDSGLAARREAFDLFEAAEDAAAGGAGAGQRVAGGLEKAIDRHLQGLSQAEGGFGGEAQAAALVIRQQGLRQAGGGGELDLG